jgi:Cu-Zn family superoxide dismutase
MLKRYLLVATCSIITTVASAKSIIIPVNFTAEHGVGASAGTITIQETPYGLLFTPNLHGLTPGAHGFHIHQNPSCANNGMAAAGHFDPRNTGKHLGPYNNNGHYGDLPVLTVNSNGTARLPVLAPRLRGLMQIKQHALMLHHGGDNYSDKPQKLGGGGVRMVCGVI